MIYADWMSYIKDDAKINKIAIPGSHNAGSYGMGRQACCQDDNLYTQFLYGIRQFCIRLNTRRDGTIVLAHGLLSGVPFEELLADLKRALDYNDTEFFILDICPYYDQEIGPLTLRYRADPAKVDALMEKYLDPAKNALCDFDDIGSVTMGDIRKAGKRFVLINETNEYKYRADCECIRPWDPLVFGLKAPKFAKATVKYFDKFSTDGFYWFQTQMTPNFGTEVGIRTPRALDEQLRPFYGEIIRDFEDDPRRLANVNIVAGDFMSKDYLKVRKILGLNLAKGIVKEDKADEYREGLYR